MNYKVKVFSPKAHMVKRYMYLIAPFLIALFVIWAGVYSLAALNTFW